MEVQGVKTLMDKHTIIKLKQEGHSNRKVAELMNINRKTVAKYWNEYKDIMSKLENPNYDVKLLQEQLNSEPRYDTSNRSKPKYTKELDEFLDKILLEEEKKNQRLKNHKQNLTAVQIHEIIIEEGFDISYPSIANYVRKKRNKKKECFIRQEYDLGDRLEYDFGQVKLVIDEQTENYHLAVLSSPASNFRWAYLYKNQTNEVFLDSHIRFFDMIGGVYKEIVYDNMRNVVTKFIGKNEKEINTNLLTLSNYYGFTINVTNCFSGNEKGHVEGSVKIVRNKVFAKRYEFDNLNQAEEYLEKELIKINEGSTIRDEVKRLLPLKPTLDLATITEQKVNSYSFVQIDKNWYSVPDYLVGKTVTIRKYTREIKIYLKNKHLCTHKRKDGANEASIDIKHYLTSFARKPGALRNSLALKNTPYLKSIFDNHFTKEPKKFVELLKENQEKDMDQIIDALNTYVRFGNNMLKDIVNINNDMETKTRLIVRSYDSLKIGVKNGY